MKRSIVSLCALGLIGAVACSSDPGADPGGGAPNGGSDASTHDASKPHGDASSPGSGSDAAKGDDGSASGDDDGDDSGSIGAGQDDSGSDDSGPITPADSGSHDSGAHDSGHDSGPVDSGSHDSGIHDSGIVDTGSSDAAIALQQLCVNEVNRYRATNGKPPLARWTAEETCADGQSKSDSASGTAHGAFGQCNEFGQCECPGWGGPLETMILGCLKAMWDEGPGGGHYDIMNSDSYTKVACGFYTMTNGKIWSVQDYK